MRCLVVDNGHLYIGGYFATVAGQTRGRAASFDLATGNLDSWNPNATSGLVGRALVYAIAASQNTIYLGGTFGAVGVSESCSTSRRWMK